MAMSTFLKVSFSKYSNVIIKSCAKQSIISKLTRPNVCQKAYYNTTGRSKRITKFFKMDGMPENFDLVYRNPATGYIEIAQILSVIIGLSCSIGVTYIYSTGMTLHSEPYGEISFTELSIATATLLFTCCLVQFICYKNPVRIYSHGKKFVLVLYNPLGRIPNLRKIEFNAGNCVKDERNFYLLMRDCRYKINGKIYLIFDDHFKSNADYNKMMGS